MNSSPHRIGLHLAKKTRDPIVAGLFYPATRSELADKIHSLIRSVPVGPGRSAALISPHGSLDYSGAVAAAAWNSVHPRNIGTLVVLSPSHRAYEQGIFLPESRVFSIPTADFNVDRPLLRELRHSTTNIIENDIPHLEDHGIEMQLLFAAHLCPEASLLPIIVSNMDAESLDSLFSNLHFMLGDRIASTLFVMSSNMAVESDETSCRAATSRFLQCVVERDLEGLSAARKEDHSFCGASIIAAYLRSNLSSAMDGRILAAPCSSPFTEIGDPVVGYGAVGFSR
ncbi:MAG: hypothetical protein FD137_1955 [Spirochaetes bacterium]|nr:MAG: hypothetical protein FD137_1955 [Spirochaetota bacterium]